MAWFETYERDVLGDPGKPWPTRPRPISLPDPPAENAPFAVAEPPGRTGGGPLGLVLDAIRTTFAAVRR
ncbi:hypothetical protein [Nocardia sp. NPDC052566]|uniref:hypothetical protein n=1 Tax=Nocardia sp. NPDC052566 TaxID=3364330 RepID=UPI0037C61981